MKKIKFRKYDQSRDGFIYSYRLDGSSATTFDFDPADNDENWIGTRKKRQLMQYTGVDDKTGCPIYEGDIVSIDCGKHLKMPVFFDRGKFVPVYKFSSNQLKIIGNVFEEEESEEN